MLVRERHSKLSTRLGRQRLSTFWLSNLREIIVTTEVITSRFSYLILSQCWMTHKHQACLT